MADEVVPDPQQASLGEWLAGQGPDADVAVCTRVRLARNVETFRFAAAMNEEEAAELTTYLEREIARLEYVEPLRILDLTELDELDLRVLIERHLISRELANAPHARGVAVDEPESVSIMINEEDHIRAQIFLSGLRVEEAFRRAELLDNMLMERVPLAFSEEFGFLTSCPTNVGTGLRVSVMLHLPAMAWTGEIDRVMNSAQKINLAVRGLYGEGSRSLGDLFQVSNQVTLGRSEAEILGDVESAVRQYVEWERKLRQALLEGERRARTEDRVHRALGVLERARILTTEEALTNLSAVRLGVQQGILDAPGLDRIHRALLLSQPAHLQRVCKASMTPQERDGRRALLIRKILSSGD